MTIDWKKIKGASPDDPIYRGEKYTVYKINSVDDYIRQREKDTGLKNVFFEKIDSKKPRKEILKSMLEKLGLKYVKEKRNG